MRAKQLIERQIKEKERQEREKVAFRNFPFLKTALERKRSPRKGNQRQARSGRSSKKRADGFDGDVEHSHGS
jgi:hypothetical protein